MPEKIEGKTAKEWTFAGINYNLSKNYQKAIECFEKVVKIDPQFKEAWYSMGHAYKELGNHQKEVECFEKAK